MKFKSNLSNLVRNHTVLGQAPRAETIEIVVDLSMMDLDEKLRRLQTFSRYKISDDDPKDFIKYKRS